MAAVPSQTVSNPIPSTVPAAVTAELPKQVTVAFNSQSADKSNEGTFDVLYATDKADPFRTGNVLFERAEFRRPSGERWNLYHKETPADISLSGQLYTLPVLVHAFLRECVCMSTVFVLSTTKEIGKKQSVMLAFVEFPPGQDKFLIDAYCIDSLEDHQLECINSLWLHVFPQLTYNIDDSLTKVIAEKADQIAGKRQIAQFPITDMLAAPDSEHLAKIMVEQEHHHQLSIQQEIQVIARLLMQNAIPLSQEQQKQLGGRMNVLIDEYQKIEKHLQYIPHGPYHPQTHKLTVILDLDKTLFLSDADARVGQKHAFISDYEISGSMAITNERFQHQMMIRPGCYWFLRRLHQVANVYAVTAGDLHYARAAVTHANARKWISKKDITTDLEDFEKLPDVFIPLTHVFSLRNHAKRAAPKTLERALPWVQYMISSAGGTVLIVDDDPGAWDVAVRHHVIPISPFQPLNNSHENLLHVVWLIEMAAQRLFTNFHADLAKMSHETPIEHPMPIGLQVDVQFFDSGRYAVFSNTGMAIDVRNGVNKMLCPEKFAQFCAEHTPVGEPHTLEYSTGVPVIDVPVYMQMFNDGRYVVIRTETRSPFMAFKYGEVMPFPDNSALEQFLLTEKPLVSAFHIGGGAIGSVVPAADVGAAMPAANVDDAMPAADIGDAIEEVPLVRESYNHEQVVLYKVDDGYIATEKGKFIIMLLTAEEHAEFVSNLILDRPLNKLAKILFKTQNVVEVVQQIVNAP